LLTILQAIGQTVAARCSSWQLTELQLYVHSIYVTWRDAISASDDDWLPMTTAAAASSYCIKTLLNCCKQNQFGLYASLRHCR